MDKVLVSGGIFVFNTFNTKPAPLPRIKQYVLNGLAYTELSYCISDKVMHVQCVEGMAPHITQFNWISREEFHAWLDKFFDCEEEVSGTSSRWICTKK